MAVKSMGDIRTGDPLKDIELIIKTLDRIEEGTGMVTTWQDELFELVELKPETVAVLKQKFNQARVALTEFREAYTALRTRIQPYLEGEAPAPEEPQAPPEPQPSPPTTPTTPPTVEPPTTRTEGRI